MVDPSVVTKRLGALEGYVDRLREFRTISREQFIAEPDVHHLAERYLHLACECVLDIAQHVVSDAGFRQPESYRDALAILDQEGILPTDLAERLQRWMGFRNILVHLYLEVDHGIVYRAIRDQLEDLDQFAAAISRLI